MIKIIKEVSKKELKEFLYNINLEDINLYNEINKENIFGIFQFDGSTANNLVKKIHPNDFEEMVAVNALSRPGTIDFANEYNKNKEIGTSNFPAIFNPILKSSHNVPIYQEQVMAIFNQIGGFSLEETNEVRSLMKKLGKADKSEKDLKRWDEIVNRFSNEADKKGLKVEEAKKITDILLRMSSYLFNRSHAVAYTYIAIMTLYLSYYFKSYFFSATLTYEAEKQDNLKKRINDAKLFGFTILPPDINKSNIHFVPEGNMAIRFGLNEIKFVGIEAASKLIENKPYSSILEAYYKNIGNRITSRVFASLIKAGAFDDIISKERKKYSYIYDQFNERKKSIKVIEKLQVLWDTINKETESIVGLETTNKDLIDYEKEYFGFPLFNSIFDDKIIQILIELNKRNLCELYLDELNEKQNIRIPLYIESFRIMNDKNGKEMAFLNGVDLSEKSIRIPIFQNYWKSVKDNFKGEGFYLIYLFRNIDKDNEIFFGAKKWLDDESKKRLLKRIG